MKKYISLPLPVILLLCVFTSYAQRRVHESDNNARRSTTSSQQRNSSRSPYISSQVRNTRENNINRNILNSHRNEVAVLENRHRVNSSIYSRHRNYRLNTFERERYVNRNIYNNYNYNNYYRSRYYPHVSMTGPRYRIIPRGFVTINFGGYPYYYNKGWFYGSYGGYYQPLYPPPGIRIGVLPFGYARIFVGITPFFYFNGIFYRHQDKDYEVVDAPMGATVSSLPKGAKSVVLNGEKLYKLNRTYYREDRNSKGETVYTVVGKNGEVNDSSEADETTPLASLNNGDIMNELPDGSKVVTINGEKLYVTPDGIYLKEEFEGNAVHYKVVGK
jgi:hypothetical protein